MKKVLMTPLAFALRLLLNQRGEVTVVDPPEPAAPVEPVEPAEPVEPVEPVEPAPATMVPLTALEGERRRRQEAKEEAAYWKGVAEAGGKSTPTTPAPAAAPIGPPQAPARPKALNSADFEDYGDYEAAQAKQDEEYQAKRDDYVAAKVKHELQSDSQQRDQQQTLEQKRNKYLERLNKATELDPELQDIADGWMQPGKYQLPLSAAMQDTILESDVGPEILRHLYNNKQEAARIARLGVIAAARELVKIETTITDQSKTTPRRVSNAPPPITPVTARGAVEVDDDKRPAADVIREYREAEAKRR